jgi:hypothetical protein
VIYDCPACRGGDYGQGCRVCHGTGVYTPGDDSTLFYPKPTAEQAEANYQKLQHTQAEWIKQICQTLKN